MSNMCYGFKDEVMRNFLKRNIKNINIYSLIVIFSLYFCYDLFTLKKALIHPDIFTYYYPFRQWFSGILRDGGFPLWNPYWGLGQAAVVWSSIPLDFYTIAELLTGAKYHHLQIFQLIALLSVCFCFFRVLQFSYYGSLFGAMAFFLSPWVMYWFFYFIVTTSHIFFVIILSLIIVFFQKPKRIFLFLICLSVFCSMLGTKLEFWFYQSMFLLIFTPVSGALFCVRNKLMSISKVYISILTGILGNLWQLTILIPVLINSGRINNKNINYSDFFISIKNSVFQSSLVQMLIIYLFFVVLVKFFKYIQKKYLRNYNYKIKLIVVIILIACSTFAYMYDRNIKPIENIYLLKNWVSLEDGSYIPENSEFSNFGDCQKPKKTDVNSIILSSPTSANCYIRFSLNVDKMRDSYVQISFDIHSLEDSPGLVQLDYQNGVHPIKIWRVELDGSKKKKSYDIHIPANAIYCLLTINVDSQNKTSFEISNLNILQRSSSFSEKFFFFNEYLDPLKLLVNNLISSFYGIAILAGCIAFLIIKPEKNNLLFIFGAVLIIFYYYRVLPNDLGESDIILLEPDFIKSIIVSLAIFGIGNTYKFKTSVLSVCMIGYILIMRDQGQIILSYFTGMLWIPTRDNYLIDICIMTLSVSGIERMSNYLKNLKIFECYAHVDSLIELSLLAILVSVNALDMYYPNKLVKKSPENFPLYNGLPALNSTFSEINKNSHLRVYILNYDAWGFTYGFGEALFNNVGQITMYDSLTPQIYKDWTIYHNLGVSADQNFSGYPGGYSNLTIQNLPKKNMLKYDNSTYYHYTVISRPPIKEDLLKLIGVSHIVDIHPITGDDVVIGADFKQLRTEISNLELKSKKRISDVSFQGVNSEHFDYEMKNIVPRAYLLPINDYTDVKEIAEELNPKFLNMDIITRNKHYEISPVDLAVYDREYVKIISNNKHDGMVILSDIYHPFWEATIDGLPTNIIPAFTLLRGLWVPSGSHVIELRCMVPYLKESSIFAIFLFFVILFAIFFDLKKPRFNLEA